jgi:hypothetical protein
MSLIINKSIPMFKKGYPTMSDKYNVAGGILTGDTPVPFGSIVMVSDTPGYFEAPASIADAKEIGGIVVATNVKLAQEWPGKTVQVNPGEAFNLLVSGFIAVKVDTIVSLITNTPVYVKADGSFTPTASGNIALPNTVFTGMYEQQADGSYLAEIYVK